MDESNQYRVAPGNLQKTTPTKNIRLMALFEHIRANSTDLRFFLKAYHIALRGPSCAHAGEIRRLTARHSARAPLGAFKWNPRWSWTVSLNGDPRIWLRTQSRLVRQMVRAAAPQSSVRVATQMRQLRLTYLLRRTRRR